MSEKEREFGADWRVVDGPVGDPTLGRLAQGREENVEFLVPPGVLSEKPEKATEVRYWRHAIVSGGQIITKATIELTTAIALAPDQEEWIVEREALDIRRDLVWAEVGGSIM